jgi:hypothetical protein
MTAMGRAAAGAGDDGHTVHVRVGQTIRLRLASTYWRVAAARPAAVLQTGARATTPRNRGAACPGRAAARVVVGA